MSDDRGEFEFGNVPPGVYTLTAERAGYLTIRYGQTRPRESGRTIQIRAGDVIDNMYIALYPGAMLSGRVHTDQGEPITNALVEAMETRAIGGRRLSVPAATATTNDIGEFLISGLPPGSYSVRASTLEPWEGEANQAQAFAFAPTYFPGTSDASQAGVITLAVGQEVVGLSVPLFVTRTLRISGRVEGLTGEPLAGMTIGISRLSRGPNGNLSERSGVAPGTETAKDGSFQIHGLIPGEYVLRTAVSSAERVTLPVVVSDADLTGIVLTPRPDSELEGAVVTDEGMAPSFRPTVVMVVPVATGNEYMLGVRDSQTSSDWTFHFPDLDGPHVFRLTGLPDGWTLKAVRTNGIDITDTPFEAPAIEGTAARLEIVITRRSSAIIGQVVDAAGRPAPGSTVIVFSADPAGWGVGTRSVKAARPDQSGRFAVTGLSSGTFLAIALEYVADREWEDPVLLQSLRSGAVPLELHEGATTQIALTVGAAR